jgi:membrane dipeptidase
MAKAAIGKAQALAKAKALMERFAFIDGHNDLPWVIRQRTGPRGDVAGYDLRKLHNDGDTDIPRLRQGKVSGQVFAAFVPSEIAHPGRATLEQLDIIARIVATYPETFQPALKAADVARAKRAGRIGVIASVEGGVGLENSLAPLRVWHAMGARLMTLCHNGTLDWCDSATDEARHGGLSAFGRAVLAELNRLGMIIDCAHVAPTVMREVLELSRAPIVFSHSNAFTLCPHPRNVPDDVLDRVPGNDGVVMATFIPDFLDPAVHAWMEPVRRHAGGFGEDRMAMIRAREAEAGPRPLARLEQVADHIEYIANRIGLRHVGVGSDFFGVPTMPVGLENVSRFPYLLAELIRRGWSDGALRGLAGGNFLRVFRAVERLGEALRRSEAPGIGTICDFEGEGAPY